MRRSTSSPIERYMKYIKKTYIRVWVINLVLSQPREMICINLEALPFGRLRPHSHASTVFNETPIKSAKERCVIGMAKRICFISSGVHSGGAENRHEILVVRAFDSPRSYEIASLSPCAISPYRENSDMFPIPFLKVEFQ